MLTRYRIALDVAAWAVAAWASVRYLKQMTRPRPDDPLGDPWLRSPRRRPAAARGGAADRPLLPTHRDRVLDLDSYSTLATAPGRSDGAAQEPPVMWWSERSPST